MRATASAILMTWRPGSVIGAPLMRPESFRNAIMEPVNVMAPMATPSDISIRLWPWMAPSTPMPKAACAYSAPAATSTAAMPRRACRHKYRGHAHQRVERGDQFRHRGHRHAPRDHRAEAAAETHAEHDQGP